MAKGTLFDRMFMPNLGDVVPTAIDKNMEDIVHATGDGTVHAVDEFGGDDYYFEEVGTSASPITQEDYEDSMWADDMLISGDESIYGYEDEETGNPVG